MKSLLLVLALLSPTTPVVAHELTPTYPDLKPSYVDGLLVARLSMFNAREDVEYYEIGVYDESWNKVPFATTDKIAKVPYGEHKSFEVYVRKQDKKRAVYVCTVSKLRSDKPSFAIISSKVCSRLDGALP
jgi:hypothetical protein